MHLIVVTIRFLESRLARYDDVTPFDPNAMADEDQNDYGTIDDEYKEYCEKKKENIFIDEEEESHQRVVCQIGEGATSIAYKAIDERTNEEMCKKVLKVEEDKTTFKEFEVLQQLPHPSICKCIKMTTTKLKLKIIIVNQSRQRQLSSLSIIQ